MNDREKFRKSNLQMSGISYLPQNGTPKISPNVSIPTTLDLEECPEVVIVASEDTREAKILKSQPIVSKSIRERIFLTTLLRFQRPPISPDSNHPPNARIEENDAKHYPQPHESQRPRGGADDSPEPEDPKKRRKFTLKVYAIVLLLIVVTVAIVVFCFFEQNTKAFLLGKYCIVVFFTTAFVAFASIIILVCIPGSRRKFPYNMIPVAVLVIAMGFLLGLVAVQVSIETMLSGFGLALALAVFVSLVAIFTPLDATGPAGTICLLTLQILFVIAFLVSIFGFVFDIVALVVPFVVVFFASSAAFLAFDTQRLFGGRTMVMDPDDYILGAVTIYVDLIPFFLVGLVVTLFCEWLVK